MFNCKRDFNVFTQQIVLLDTLFDFIILAQLETSSVKVRNSLVFLSNESVGIFIQTWKFSFEFSDSCEVLSFSRIVHGRKSERIIAELNFVAQQIINSVRMSMKCRQMQSCKKQKLVEKFPMKFLLGSNLFVLMCQVAIDQFLLICEILGV